MKRKDFFILIVKLFGLYSMIIVLFNILPQNLSYIGSYGVDTTMIMIAIAISLLTIGLFILLLNKAPSIVKLLRLEKDFESEHFNVGNLSEEALIKVSSIILGGITVIENLPSLISYTLFAVSSSNTGEVMQANDKFYWIASLVQILVGLFLILNYSFLLKLLKNKSASQEL